MNIIMNISHITMATQKTTIKNLIQNSGVKFGTSGVRGLVTAMTDKVCYIYAMAFVQYLQAKI